MSLKTGSGALNVEANTKVVIRAEGRVTVLTVNSDGEPSGIFASSANGVVRFRVGGADANLYVKVGDGLHWSADLYPIGVFDPADPIPKEPPEEMAKKVTLEDKLKDFIQEMVAERYGDDSDQMETWEEFNDFGDDDDVPYVKEGQPVEPPEPESEPPEPELQPEPEPGHATATQPPPETQPEPQQ
jgi:hypothetical protein